MRGWLLIVLLAGLLVGVFWAAKLTGLMPGRQGDGFQQEPKAESYLESVVNTRDRAKQQIDDIKKAREDQAFW